MEKKRIITIGREFGSGGRTIGKEVADRLGIPCYDHELIDRLAEESGLSKEYITNESEYASHSSWTAAAFSSVRSFGVPSNQDYLWAIQRRIILELGQKENCVIVGRCADDLLSSYEGLTRIFIHAPLEYRLAVVMERHQLSESSARTLIRKTDKKRASYYNFYTSKDWGSSQNYDITINAAVLGVDKTAALLKDFVLARG